MTLKLVCRVEQKMEQAGFKPFETREIDLSEEVALALRPGDRVLFEKFKHRSYVCISREFRQSKGEWTLQLFLSDSPGFYS